MDRTDIREDTIVQGRSSRPPVVQGKTVARPISTMRLASSILSLVMASGANCVTCSVGFSPPRRNATKFRQGAALAARLLLRNSSQVAGLYLLERLRKRVKPMSATLPIRFCLLRATRRAQAFARPFGESSGPERQACCASQQRWSGEVSQHLGSFLSARATEVRQRELSCCS
jgi:hypothetical protein